MELLAAGATFPGRDPATPQDRAFSRKKSYDLHNVSSLICADTRDPSHRLAPIRNRAMAILDILEYPDPRLRTRAKPVDRVDDAVRRLIDDMFETMYEAPGIGLAATQLNFHRRIIVVDVSENRDQPHALINPEIATFGEPVESQEGCLSVPGFYEPVYRAERIRVSALDREGRRFEMDAEGLLAICVQHECDHLEGKLFVDYLSNLKRSRIRRKLEKHQRQPA